MSDRRVVWLMVAVALLGTMAAGVSLAPTGALFSDTETFDDNQHQLGAADDWDRVAITTAAPANVTTNESATLTVTLENVGAGPVVSDYEIIVDNESVDSGLVELASGDAWTTTYDDFDTTETDELDWKVTANNETETGTLDVVAPQNTTQNSSATS